MKTSKFTRETVKDFGVFERNFPNFGVGDTIAVSQWVIEEDLTAKGAAALKKRLQVFEGDVLAFHKSGSGTTFTVRKIGANNIAVERIYPFYSPVIESIAVVTRGSVRRAKLNYIRDRVGKSARIKPLVLPKEQRVAVEAKHAKVAEARVAREAVAVKRCAGKAE